MKVNFTRKPTPEEIYPQSEFITEKVVRLKPEEFKEPLHLHCCRHIRVWNFN